MVRLQIANVAQLNYRSCNRGYVSSSRDVVRGLGGTEQISVWVLQGGRFCGRRGGARAAGVASTRDRELSSDTFSEAAQYFAEPASRILVVLTLMYIQR